MVSSLDARNRVITGGFLLCLEVPVGSQVGLGLRLHSVGPKFLGYKGIPAAPGRPPILLQTSSAVAGPSSGVRVGSTGCFLPDASDRDVFIDGVAIVLWDHERETLSLTDKNWPQRAEWTARARNMELDANLAMWSKDEEEEWISLVRHLSTDLLAKCGMALGAGIEPTGDGHLETLAEGVRSPATGLVTPKFSSTKRARKPHFEATPAEITAFNLDASQHLESLLANTDQRNPSWLLGELQLAFVLFLVLSSLPGLEQWKNLVDILCRCDKSLCERPEFFVEFIDVLTAQLDRAPADLFTDELSQDNFLRHSLTQISQIVEESEEAELRNLRTTMVSFRRRIEKNFGWIIPTQGNSYALFDEDEEDGPVYVPFEECMGHPEPVPIQTEERSALESTNEAFVARRQEMEKALDSLGATDDTKMGWPGENERSGSYSGSDCEL